MITDQDYELISAFLDGELPAAEALAVRKRLLAEPELRAQLGQMQAADERLRSALDAPGADTVPDQVVSMLTAGETASAGLSSVRRAGWGLAIAASVLAASGLLLNPGWTPQNAASDPLLAEVLESSASRGSGWDSLADGRQVRPVLSFRSVAGNWCREYLVQDGQSSERGVACRQTDADWRIRVISESGAAGSTGEYRPASAGDADRIAAFIDNNASDIPLSASREARLIEGHWQD